MMDVQASGSDKKPSTKTPKKKTPKKPVENGPGMQTSTDPAVWIVGDVHGCIAEFSELLAKIFEESGDSRVEIYFLGDLIDKGNDSKAVLEMVFLSSYPNVTIKSIMGNHSEKFLRWCIAQDREDSGGFRNEVRNKWEFEKIREYSQFIAELPLWLSLPEYGILLVHGGIEPRMMELPPSRLAEASKHQKNILRTRYVSPEGKMITLGEERLDQGDRWWADVYDGRFGTVIYGHQPFDEVTYHQHAIGLDTGVVYGGRLSALRLSEDGNHKVVSVQAQRKYAKAYDE